jgi:hypothetical protein
VHNNGNGGDPDHQPARGGCKDPLFAILFYINVGAIVVVAILYGPGAFSSTSSFDYTGYIYAAAISAVLSLIFSALGLAVLTGRRDWPLCPSAQVRPPRLAAALAHAELRVVSVREDALRPRFLCRVVSEATHAPFRGFNRAQAAVIEAAILFSRRHLLPPAAIAAQLAALRPLVEKTAGAAEREAWGWLAEAMAGSYQVS